MLCRVPLFLLEEPESVFDLRPMPSAILVDLEGTLTGFCPLRRSVAGALVNFDTFAKSKGVDLSRLHYVTNAGVRDIRIECPAISDRIHLQAHKPFFTPPKEFRADPMQTIVVGDQYLTDGLLAWRWGFSFGLVRWSGQRPLWPRLQLAFGGLLSNLCFKTDVLQLPGLLAGDVKESRNDSPYGQEIRSV